MKIVLDTNVLVSGIFFKGVPSKIIDAWFNHRFTVFATPAILEEYLRVISELSANRNPVFEHDWDETLAEICEIIPNPKSHIKICRDPHDDKFLLCAIHSQANYLVSGDSDLKVLEPEFPSKIISPKDFLNIIGK